MVQEVGKLIAGAAAARQKLATFAIDGEITFRTAADRAAFAEELGVAVTRLVDKYHDGGAAGGGGRRTEAPARRRASSRTQDTPTKPARPGKRKRSRTMTDNRKFEIVYDTELPGTPERVWEAVTKGTPGLDVPHGPVAGREDRRGVPQHLVSRMDGPDGWFNQLEHVLEPLDGGRARLHYVHSGIFADNWDQQYDGASKHTEFYLHTLGQYLKYFDGRPVVFTDIQGPAASQTPDGFVRLKKALGVDAASQGDTVEVEVDGVGRLPGKWTSPTRTSWACGPRTPCTGSSAATPSVRRWA